MEARRPVWVWIVSFYFLISYGLWLLEMITFELNKIFHFADGTIFGTIFDDISKNLSVETFLLTLLRVIIMVPGVIFLFRLKKVCQNFFIVGLVLNIVASISILFEGGNLKWTEFVFSVSAIAFVAAILIYARYLIKRGVLNGADGELSV